MADEQTTRKRTGNSLFEFIVEAIDEVLPPNSAATGRQVYLLGWERFEDYHFEQRKAQDRRGFEKALPLLSPTATETVEF
jgi:hypothetical protein